MPGANDLLKAITVVLCVAGFTTILFQRLKQPVVLGYILAGMIVGPHLPIPLVADPHTIEVLSELGIILLMFALGLEFSLRKLAKVGPTVGITAVIETSVMLWLGFLLGRAFGWTARESLFAGAVVAISSTTIIARAFDERGVTGKLRELVVGVLIVEDLIAILLMAVLTALGSVHEMSAQTLLSSGGKLLGFLVGLLSVGLLLVPRAVRAVNRLGRSETTLVASVGLCFATALLARSFGYSVALGAFIAGSLVAESGEEKVVEHLIVPVRDLFAAIFFVSVGMQIDPAAIASHWGAVLAFTALVLTGKCFGVSFGAFVTGNGTRTSVQAGMSLAQIGEFSFIIAGLGLSLGATRDFLYPVAVAVSAVTTLTTPWLIRASGPLAQYVDRKLPGPLQTFAALYGTWLERLRAGGEARTTAAAVKRLAKLLVVDVALLCGLTIGISVSLGRIASFAAAHLGIPQRLAGWGIRGVGLALALPLLVGIVRLARGLGMALARSALPDVGTGRVDLAAAPRRVLVVTLQLAILLLAALPMAALTQPFLPRWVAAVAVLGIVSIFGVVFWRSATHLQGHVKAGAEVIVEALLSSARSRPDDDEALGQIRTLMPGIGEPVPVRIEPNSAAVGKTLAELALRGVTGASVLAIARGAQGVISPTAGERIHAGDVLALAGTREAVELARELLARPAPDWPDRQAGGLGPIGPEAHHT